MPDAPVKTTVASRIVFVDLPFMRAVAVPPVITFTDPFSFTVVLTEIVSPTLRVIIANSPATYAVFSILQAVQLDLAIRPEGYAFSIHPATHGQVPQRQRHQLSQRLRR